MRRKFEISSIWYIQLQLPKENEKRVVVVSYKMDRQFIVVDGLSKNVLNKQFIAISSWFKTELSFSEKIKLFSTEEYKNSFPHEFI